jgi:hypothetical protein
MEPDGEGPWVSLQDHLKALNHDQATTKGSVARNMLTELLRHERKLLLEWKHPLVMSYPAIQTMIQHQYISARNARMRAQAVLFGYDD